MGFYVRSPVPLLLKLFSLHLVLLITFGILPIFDSTVCHISHVYLIVKIVIFSIPAQLLPVLHLTALTYPLDWHNHGTLILSLT